MPGTTFTGRLDLWRFAIHALGPQAWTGVGFEAFWSTPAVRQAEPPFGSSWDPRGIVNAHNGYLDLAIALGWPGLAFGLVVLLVLPLRDFMRVDPRCRARCGSPIFSSWYWPLPFSTPSSNPSSSRATTLSG